MFVKWRRKKLTQLKKDCFFINENSYLVLRQRFSLTCELIESFRHNERPRHRFIAYLGSIREDGDYLKGTEKFWNTVNENLKKLTLSEKTETEIRRKIADRVPPPTMHKKSISK